MKQFEQRNDFFLVVSFLFLQSANSNSSLPISDQINVLLNSCYDVDARDDLSNIFQEILLALPPAEVVGDLTKRMLLSLFLLKLEISLQDHQLASSSSSSSASNQVSGAIYHYLSYLLTQIKNFLLVTYRAWLSESSVQICETFFQAIEVSSCFPCDSIFLHKSICLD